MGRRRWTVFSVVYSLRSTVVYSLRSTVYSLQSTGLMLCELLGEPAHYGCCKGQWSDVVIRKFSCGPRLGGRGAPALAVMA